LQQIFDFPAPETTWELVEVKWGHWTRAPPTKSEEELVLLKTTVPTVKSKPQQEPYDAEFKAFKTYCERRFLLENLSIAWFKAYELFCAFLLPVLQPSMIKQGQSGKERKERQQRVFRYLDNASLPGNFIRACIHFFDTRVNVPGPTGTTHATNKQAVTLDWYSTSLDPSKHKEALKDDYKLWAKNPERVLMHNHDGDVRQSDVISKIVDLYQCTQERKAPKRVGTKRRKTETKEQGDKPDMAANSAKEVEMFGVSAVPVEEEYNVEQHGLDLYTSDLGHEAQGDEDQETTHARAHFGQILLGLLLLKRGAMCILKQYTFAHPATISYLALLQQLFDKVCLCKPFMSKKRNSEIYIVAQGFKGLGEGWKERLFRLMENWRFEPLCSKKCVEKELTQALNQARDELTKTQTEHLQAFLRSESHVLSPPSLAQWRHQFYILPVYTRSQ